jgi:hypothetical protein
MKVKVKLLWFVLFFLTVAPAFAGGWLVYHDGPYTGKIVDAETGEPIEGAAVLGIWYVGEYGHAEAPIFKFLEAKETISGKHGEFMIPSVTAFHWWPLAKLFNPHLKIFKPGYSSYEKDFYTKKTGSIITLNKLKTEKEQMEALIFVDICGLKVDDMCVPKNKIPNIIYMVENEAKTLNLVN